MSEQARRAQADDASRLLPRAGSLGFIAWPTLAVVRPFGCSRCTPNFLLLLLPSVLLYAWPVCMMSWGVVKRERRDEGSSLPPEVSVAVGAPLRT